MEREVSKTNIREVTFPEESSLIIEKILEKYGFKEIQEKGIENFLSSFDSFEKEKIFENLPGTKIARLTKEYAIGKISLTEFPEKLEKELGISSLTAEEMAKDLENNLLAFITPLEAEKPPVAEISPEKKPMEEFPEKPSEETRPSAPKDIYREPIE